MKINPDNDLKLYYNDTIVSPSEQRVEDSVEEYIICRFPSLDPVTLVRARNLLFNRRTAPDDSATTVDV